MAKIRALMNDGGGGETSISLLKEFNLSYSQTEDTTIDLNKCYLVVSYNSPSNLAFQDSAYIIRGDLTVTYGSSTESGYSMQSATTLRCAHLGSSRTNHYIIYEIS